MGNKITGNIEGQFNSFLNLIFEGKTRAANKYLYKHNSLRNYLEQQGLLKNGKPDYDSIQEHYSDSFDLISSEESKEQREHIEGFNIEKMAEEDEDSDEKDLVSHYVFSYSGLRKRLKEETRDPFTGREF